MARDFQLNEPVITALADRLALELPAALAAIALEVPAAERAILATGQLTILDYPPAAELLVAFPTIGILDVGSDFDDDTGGYLTGRHQLGITTYLADPDPRQLAWGLRRWAQATLAVAIRDRALESQGDGAAAAWATGPAGVRWGPTLGDEDDPQTLMSWVTVLLWARRSEVQD